MPLDKNKATIYDVADHAGVAISTVSRVLNDSTDVSEPTRQRVMRAIEALQFRPDRVAKTLAQKQTRSLAVAIPTFTTPFHNELLKGVRDRLRESDIDLLLFDLGSRSPQATLLNFLKRGAVDGLLLVGVPVEARVVSELEALHAPVILVGAHHEAFDSFFWDNVAGARLAVEHLLSQDHRRIAMITSNTPSLLQEERVRGYREALEAAGIALDPVLLQSGHTDKHAGFSEEAGYEAMQALLAAAPDVTAVFAISDVHAIGAWKAIRDAGRSVPTDIALVGYDDIKTSSYIGLSSIDQQMYRVGEEATSLLLHRVQEETADGPAAHRITPLLNARYTSLRPS